MANRLLSERDPVSSSAETLHKRHLKEGNGKHMNKTTLASRKTFSGDSKNVIFFKKKKRSFLQIKREGRWCEKEAWCVCCIETSDSSEITISMQDLSEHHELALPVYIRRLTALLIFIIQWGAFNSLYSLTQQQRSRKIILANVLLPHCTVWFHYNIN